LIKSNATLSESDNKGGRDKLNYIIEYCTSFVREQNTKKFLIGIIYDVSLEKFTSSIENASKNYNSFASVMSDKGWSTRYGDIYCDFLIEKINDVISKKVIAAHEISFICQSGESFLK